MTRKNETQEPLTPNTKERLAEEQERQYVNLRDKLNISLDEDNGADVDFIIFMLHGIGSNSCVLGADYRMIKYSLSSIKRYWFYQRKISTHIHLIDWKRYIIDAQNMLFDHTYVSTAKEARKVITSHVMDVGFYLNPRYCDFLLENVAVELDGEISRMRNHHSGRFKHSKIVVIGYSMGSLILYDLVCGNPGRASNLKPEDRPRLKHKVDYIFTVGSPLSCFMIFQSPQFMTTGMVLPEGVEAYNIFHPYDPVAFRWERLIYRNVENLPEPELLPYWQNNGFKNWYGWERSVQHAKSLIVDNISDVASSISKSIFSWWGNNKSNSVLVKNVAVHDKRHSAFDSFKHRLKEKAKTKAIEIADELINTAAARAEEILDPKAAGSSDTPVLVDESGEESDLQRQESELIDDGRLAEQSSNALQDMNRKSGGHLPRRYDYQLQEDITEHLLTPLGIIQSHTSYWSSKDLMFFVLKQLNKKHDPVSITTYFNSIRLKAKRLADAAVNEDLKTKFLALAEEVIARTDQLTAEDNKARAEATTTFSSTWANMTKTTQEYFDEVDFVCADPLD